MSSRYAPAARTRRLPAAWRMPIAVYVWAQVVLLAWWAGQRPGLLSPDSVRYVIHVTWGPWTADHSVLYDAMVLLSLRLDHSVELVTLAQTAAYAWLLAYTAATVRSFGVPGWCAAAPAFLLPLLPTFGAFVGTLWKDVPFAAAEVLAVAAALRLLAGRGQPQRRVLPPAVALAAAFLGIALFRNNGFLMIPIVAVCLAVALRGLRILILSLGAGALAAFFLATTVVYPAMHIQPASSSLAFGVFYGDIAYAYRVAPGTFTASDERLMAAEAPLSHWAWGGRNCYTSDPLFTPPFDPQAASINKVALAELWLRTVRRTPLVVARVRLCRGAIAWDVLPPPSDKATVGGVILRVPKDLYHPGVQVVPADVARNLQPHPVSVRLAELTAALRTDVSARSLQWLVYRGATWCYVTYLVLLVAAYRLRRRDVLAVASVGLANQVVVFAANPAQLYRYMVGPIFIGILLFPLLAARRPGAAAGPTAAELGPVIHSEPAAPVAR